MHAVFASKNALVMLGVIPIVYIFGTVGIKVNSAAYALSQADWGGALMMMFYDANCVLTFIAGLWITDRRRQKILAVGE